MERNYVCPCCGNRMSVERKLVCHHCHSIINYSDEEDNVFSRLSKEEADFILTFLVNEGNIKNTCADLNISYPTLKRRYESIMRTLNIRPKSFDKYFDVSFLDDSIHHVATNSRKSKSSDIIRDKLIQEGGFAIISLLNGDDCVVSMTSYDSFISDRLGNQEMDFKIFDIIVDFLKSEGGIAKKGGSRSKGSVVGFGQCTPDTIIYQIAKYYYKKSVGESTFDPVFVLAAMMDWAGIASNERGTVRLIY